MYAVFEDGSRQYRVSEGDQVRLDFRDVELGSRLELKRVLLYQSGQEARVGQPLVEGARIVAEVVDHPTVKVSIQKFRRRKNYRRFKGHRQLHTEVRIRNILLAGQEPPTEAKKTETPAPARQEEPKQEEAPK